MPARLGATSSRGGLPRSTGFTLVELVIVIAVLAVISAVAIPRFASASARSRLDAAALRVVQDIGIASSSAAAAGANRQLVFEPLSDQYAVVGVRTRGGGFFRSVKLGDPPYEVNVVSATFGGSPLLVLNGHGVSESDGTINLAVGRYGKRILLAEGTASVQIRSLDLASDGNSDVMPGVTRDSDEGTVDFNAGITSPGRGG